MKQKKESVKNAKPLASNIIYELNRIKTKEKEIDAYFYEMYTPPYGCS